MSMKKCNVMYVTLMQLPQGGLVTYKGCQIPEQLRRYLIGNPKLKDHKEDPSTDGRIRLNRTSAN